MEAIIRQCGWKGKLDTDSPDAPNLEHFKIIKFLGLIFIPRKLVYTLNWKQKEALG